jgi:parvulin-like peptidyl-prolyl isomerase
VVRERLLVRKAAFAVDSAARSKVTNLKNRLNGGEDFAALAAESSDDEISKGNGGDVGTVALDNADDDGLIAAAVALQPGEVSAVIEGVDGFYIIKLVEKNDTTVHYLLIKVSLTEFDKQFQDLKTQSKINEYIEIASEE